MPRLTQAEFNRQLAKVWDDLKMLWPQRPDVDEPQGALLAKVEAKP